MHCQAARGYKENEQARVGAEQPILCQNRNN